MKVRELMLKLADCEMDKEIDLCKDMDGEAIRKIADVCIEKKGYLIIPYD